MDSLTILSIDEALRDRLRTQAADHGPAMEDEAHAILAAGVGTKQARPDNLAASMRARFAPLGGIELPIPPREPPREPPTFEASSCSV